MYIKDKKIVGCTELDYSITPIHYTTRDEINISEEQFESVINEIEGMKNIEWKRRR